MVPHARVRVQDEVLTCSSRGYEAPSDLRFTIYESRLGLPDFGRYNSGKNRDLFDQSFDVDALCFTGGVAHKNGVAVGINHGAV
jgi:hypothetical protein